MEKKEKRNDPAVQQIINRVINHHFNKDPTREKTIDEIQTEIMKRIAEKSKVIDFANGETCEFN